MTKFEKSPGNSGAFYTSKNARADSPGRGDLEGTKVFSAGRGRKKRSDPVSYDDEEYYYDDTNPRDFVALENSEDYDEYAGYGSEYDIDEFGLEESEKASSISPHGIGVFFRGALRPFTIFILSVAIVASGVLIGYRYIDAHYISPPDINDSTPITVEIKRGSSLSAISKTLYDSGVIQDKTVFKFYADFSDMGKKLKAGTYTLSKDMTMDDIILVLSQGDGKPSVTKFTVTEGQSIEDMAETLHEKGALKDKDNFLDLCGDGGSYSTYSFIADILPITPEDEGDAATPANAATGGDLETGADAEAEERKYMLEGYLFPDTYEIYVDSSEDTIIRKMLDRFSQIFNDVYVSRANELNMSIDEVVTLASIIEREGKPQDFKKISAVFHNRLKDEQKLESCATVQYLLEKRKYNLSASELAIDSPFNTYKYSGLPAGPISNPGKDAIEAALYPDEQYMKDGYMFFCSGDPEKGELVFAKTLDEHEANKAKYKPYWEAFDAKYAN